MNGSFLPTRPRLRGLSARLVLIALACALALSTFVSTLAIAELHEHDCTGDECPICLVLELSQAVLLLAVSDSSIALVAALSLVSAGIVFAMRGFVLSAETPVSLKVRLAV